MRTAKIFCIVLIVLGNTVSIISLIGVYNKPKQPELFDSMLCSVHTPMAAILVNGELIKCTDGEIYRRVN